MDMGLVRGFNLSVLLGLVLFACAAPKQTQVVPVVESQARPLPDLVVDESELQKGWRITNLTTDITDPTTEKPALINGKNCDAIEGGYDTFTGDRVVRKIIFDVTTLNIGDGPLHLGKVADLAAPGYDKTQSQTKAMKDLSYGGYVEWASCFSHNHWHYRNYSKYELIKLNADDSFGTVYRGRKQGYCMYDTQGAYAPKDATGSPMGKLYPISPDCAYQGLSPGWGDNYWKTVAGQNFILNDYTDPTNPNAPGQVLPGNYILRVTVNPPFFPIDKELCPVRFANGTCRMFAEKNYNNNQSETKVTLKAADVYLPVGITLASGGATKAIDAPVNKGIQHW